MMDITATIVTYNNDINVLAQAIDSFLNTDLAVKLYVVDNSQNIEISKLAEKKQVSYVSMAKNIGFGAGHNYVMRQPHLMGRYHLVLNPDVRFDQGVLEQLLRFMDRNPDVGNIMPRILYPDGNIQYLCKLLPRPIDLIGRMFIPLKSVKRRINTRFEMRFTAYNRMMNVPYLSGCFMFLRKEAIERVGVFDERIFMYGEDTDLNRRIYAHYRTVFFPDVSIIHEYSKGSYRNLRLFLIHLKAIIYYFNKWGWFGDSERGRINRLTIDQYTTP